MAIAFAVNNGNWSNTATWSGSYIPQPGDDVFANNRIVDVDVSFEVATLRSTSGTGITAGGSFRFLSGSISGSVTDSSPLVPGATNLVQVTATTGTVTLTLGGSVTPRSVSSDTLINHSGNCNFNLSGTLFRSNQTYLNISNITCISKTSTGTITINGNIQGGVTNSGNGIFGFSSNAGNTIIIGNVTSNGGNYVASTFAAVIQSAGNLIITGNVTATSTSNASTVDHAVIFSGTGNLNVTGNVVGGNSGINCNGISTSTGGTVNITGNVTGGITSVGISTSSPVNIINGTVTGGTAAAISSTTANQINVSGSVVASTNANAITSTNASGIVILNGNITNNAGKQAIYCQNLFLSDTGTTQAQFFTSGSQDRTLYSANTFPNLPSSSIVRSTTLYGPGNELSGSLIMPDPANVRYGVPTDNTTGSALLSAQSLFDEIATSTNPVAVRLRKSSTTDTFGNMLTAFKK